MQGYPQSSLGSLRFDWVPVLTMALEEVTDEC